jgi:hypothetical protein
MKEEGMHGTKARQDRFIYYYRSGANAVCNSIILIENIIGYSSLTFNIYRLEHHNVCE